MAKKTLIAAVVVVGLLLGGAFLLSLVIGAAATAAVNQFGPAFTGTTVRLDGARISPLTGSGTLTGLHVGNPPGWTGDTLLAVDTMHLDLKPLSLLGETIVVEDVVVHRPRFNYQTKIVASNLGDLLEAVEKATGGKNQSASAPATDDARPVKLAVKRFLLKGGTVSIGAGDAAVSVPLPDLELNDLGTPENGLTPAQLTVAVAKEVTQDVLKAASGALGTVGGTAGAAAAESAKGAAKKASDGIKKLFGGDKKP
jgi:uncharacterized protein involved in outer membrane biogenesis